MARLQLVRSVDCGKPIQELGVKTERLPNPGDGKEQEQGSEDAPEKRVDGA